MGQPGLVVPKAALDQFGTYEVFVQPKDGKPFQHEGVVHAPNLEMAFILAKETFTRRFTCASLYVAETRNVFVSPLAEGAGNAYDLLPNAAQEDDGEESYEIFHLARRGKQHVHAGTVSAGGPNQAMVRAREQFGGKPVLNIWALRTRDIRFTAEEERDLWLTLPEKKFRDAADYKGGDRLKSFLDRMRS